MKPNRCDSPEKIDQFCAEEFVNGESIRADIFVVGEAFRGGMLYARKVLRQYADSLGSQPIVAAGILNAVRWVENEVRRLKREEEK